MKGAKAASVSSAIPLTTVAKSRPGRVPMAPTAMVSTTTITSLDTMSAVKVSTSRRLHEAKVGQIMVTSTSGKKATAT